MTVSESCEAIRMRTGMMILRIDRQAAEHEWPLTPTLSPREGEGGTAERKGEGRRAVAREFSWKRYSQSRNSGTIQNGFWLRATRSKLSKALRHRFQ